jgi:hypothetical protein
VIYFRRDMVVLMGPYLWLLFRICRAYAYSVVTLCILRVLGIFEATASLSI